MHLSVFLDTNVLLKGLAALRKGAALPPCFCDGSAKRYTFEKCVFESYMAFRGVGGKKPDEGRGRWAESHLNGEFDPATVGKLSSLCHGGSTDLARYWANQILEVRDCIDEYEEQVIGFVGSEDHEELRKHVRVLRRLADEHDRFDSLCDKFRAMLDLCAVTVLPYLTVFDCRRGRGGHVNSTALDRLVRESILPSEDFEIIFAAMTIPADVFVTDDKRLIACTWSLGLNFPMSVENFCESAEYEAKIQQIKAERR